MKRFIEGENRFQSTLFPESLEDYIAKDNSIRIVDAFVDKLKLKELGFDRAEPSDTGRPKIASRFIRRGPLRAHLGPSSLLRQRPFLTP
jgi:transposase